jgi:hypothetical protein
VKTIWGEEEGPIWGLGGKLGLMRVI